MAVASDLSPCGLGCTDTPAEPSLTTGRKTWSKFLAGTIMGATWDPLKELLDCIQGVLTIAQTVS